MRFADDLDLRSTSFLLHAGEYPLGVDFNLQQDQLVGRIDNSGMSVDAFDNTAISMVHPHAYRPDPAVASGTIDHRRQDLRCTPPDLVIEDVSLGAPFVSQGETLDVDVRVRNQGDGPSQSASLDLKLSLDQRIFPDTLLATAAVPAIAPAGEVTVRVPAVADAAPGRYSS